MNYKEQLTKEILPFWLNKAVDYKNGGIFTCLDECGEIYGREKSVWFQGRSLWSFSKTYNLIDKNPEYIKAAKRIFEFLPKCTDTDGRMFFIVTEDGRKIRKRRYYFSETFAAIGCAEYYIASGDEKALAAARKYFEVAYECFVGVRATEPKNDPETMPLKSLSPVMIMLSTAQTMRACDAERSSYYDGIAKDCLEEILDGGFLRDKVLLENVRIDGKPDFSLPAGRVVNPGHSIEAAWFIMLEGMLTGNERALQAGKRILDFTLPIGWDEKHGGVIAFADACGKPPTQLEWDMKLWWPQCETMIATRMAYEIFGDEKYFKLWRNLEEYCQKFFADKKHGEWYGYLHNDNSVSTTLKGNIFKGPFHIPRLYIIMAMLEEGKPIESYVKDLQN